MRISDEVVKEHHLYKSLEERFKEACDYISYLSSGSEWMTEELKYLQDFISYKKLTEEYIHFREHAHLEDDPEVPFPSYIL